MPTSPNFSVLGAGYGTGNMGVAALASGTITVLARFFPGAAISLIDYAASPAQFRVSVDGRDLSVPLFPIRFLRGLLNNVFFLVLASLFARICPPLRAFLASRSDVFNLLSRSHAVLALNGGDSFADIYGLKRLVYVSAPIWLARAVGRPVILLPQTYGPFSSFAGRSIARSVLRSAASIFSRDQEGIRAVQSLLPGSVPVFAHDMAFNLMPRPPAPDVLDPFQHFLGSSPLIGINVSGLLASGGYSGGNMFGLSVDYASLLRHIVSDLADLAPAHKFVLVPHVFGSDSRENDISASRSLFQSLPNSLQTRVFCLEHELTDSELKHFIGQCEFFLGSRMHACIAALSQGIPAVGLAYSKKFSGVFASIGVDSSALDLRIASPFNLRQSVTDLFLARNSTRATLAANLASVSSVAPAFVQILRGVCSPSSATSAAGLRASSVPESFSIG